MKKIFLIFAAITSNVFASEQEIENALLQDLITIAQSLEQSQQMIHQYLVNPRAFEALKADTDKLRAEQKKHIDELNAAKKQLTGLKQVIAEEKGFRNIIGKTPTQGSLSAMIANYDSNVIPKWSVKAKKEPKGATLIPAQRVEDL